MGAPPVIFLNPPVLLIGLAVVAVIVLGLAGHAGRRRRLARFLGGERAARRLSGSDLYRLRLERILLLAFAALMAAAAASQPRWTVDSSPPPLPRRVVLAIDVSASMQTVDASPTRLARGLEVAGELIEHLGGDQVGLLVFAGTPYPIAPPTRDHEALRYFLTALSPTMASAHDPGSLLAVGIRDGAALAGVGDEPAAERFVVLIGDGETPEAASALVAEVGSIWAEGTRVHAIGVGTAEGGAMVMPQATYQFGGPVVDESGLPAISRMNEPLLQRIAEVGGGRYAAAADAGALEALYASFDVGASIPFWARHEPAVLFVLAALAGLLIESVLDVRLPRRAGASRRRTA